MDYAGLSGAVAIIIALVQVAKKAGLPTRFAGVLSVLLGVAAGFAVMLSKGSTDYVGTIGAGVIAGLMASGSYSGTRALVKKSL